MNDLSAGSERAVLVHINFRSAQFNEDLDELTELAASSGVHAAVTITCNKNVPNASFFIGEGKMQEIKQAVGQQNADIVIFNHEITPAQERNLEREL